MPKRRSKPKRAPRAARPARAPRAPARKVPAWPPRIAELRSHLRFTQGELAALLGVHRVTVTLWERVGEGPSLTPDAWRQAILAKLEKLERRGYFEALERRDTVRRLLRGYQATPEANGLEALLFLLNEARGLERA